jgi:hypothetical protein
VFSVTVVVNGDGSVPRRVRVTEQGSYQRGWAAGKTRRPAWRAAPALSFLTCDLAFSRERMQGARLRYKEEGVQSFLQTERIGIMSLLSLKANLELHLQQQNNFNLKQVKCCLTSL